MAGGSWLHWRSPPRGRGLKMSSRYVIAYIDPIVGQPGVWRTRCVAWVRAPTPTSAHAPIRARAAEHTSTRRAFHFRFHAHLSEERRQPASSRVSTRGTQLQVSKNSLNGEEGGEGGACKNASCDEHGMPSFLPSPSSMEETRVLRTNERNLLTKPARLSV